MAVPYGGWGSPPPQGPMSAGQGGPQPGFGPPPGYSQAGGPPVYGPGGRPPVKGSGGGGRKLVLLLAGVAVVMLLVVVGVVVARVVGSSSDERADGPVDPLKTVTGENTFRYQDLPDPCAIPRDVLTELRLNPDSTSPTGVGTSDVALCGWNSPSDVPGATQVTLITVVTTYTFESWERSTDSTIIAHSNFPDGRKVAISVKKDDETNTVDECQFTWGTSYGSAGTSLTQLSILNKEDLCKRLRVMTDRLYPLFRK